MKTHWISVLLALVMAIPVPLSGVNSAETTTPISVSVPGKRSPLLSGSVQAITLRIYQRSNITNVIIQFPSGRAEVQINTTDTDEALRRAGSRLGLDRGWHQVVDEYDVEMVLNLQYTYLEEVTPAQFNALLAKERVRALHLRDGETEGQVELEFEFLTGSLVALLPAGDDEAVLEQAAKLCALAKKQYQDIEISR